MLTTETIARFWSYVEKNGPTLQPDLGPCWIWTGGCFTRKGGKKSYGCFSIRGRPQYAHRVAWQIEHGTIRRGVQVLHHCDNEWCVRTAHLFEGTHADNMLDKKKKGRAPRVRSRLTEEQVKRIRSAKRHYGWTPAMARELGVSVHTVYQVLYGHSWKGVTP